jgi:hypothetical protein
MPKKSEKFFIKSPFVLKAYGYRPFLRILEGMGYCVNLIHVSLMPGIARREVQAINSFLKEFELLCVFVLDTACCRPFCFT